MTDTPTTPTDTDTLVPREAKIAADAAIIDNRTPEWTMSHCVRTALTAAAPYIAAELRGELAEARAELDRLTAERDQLTRELAGMQAMATSSRDYHERQFTILYRAILEVAGLDPDQQWPGNTAAVSALNEKVERLRTERDLALWLHAEAVWNYNEAVEEQEVYAELYSSMGTHAFELRESRESLRHLAARLGDERTDAWVRIARALELHSEFKIYDGCGHQHIDDDPGTFEVENVGLTCDEGYEYSICRECCTGGTGYQSEMCVGSHTRPCWPCPTHTALTGPAAEAGTEADR